MGVVLCLCVVYSVVWLWLGREEVIVPSNGSAIAIFLPFTNPTHKFTTQCVREALGEVMVEEDDAAAEAPDAAGAGAAAAGRESSLLHESVRVLLDAGERLRLPKVRLSVWV